MHLLAPPRHVEERCIPVYVTGKREEGGERESGWGSRYTRHEEGDRLLMFRITRVINLYSNAWHRVKRKDYQESRGRGEVYREKFFFFVLPFLFFLEGYTSNDEWINK